MKLKNFTLELSSKPFRNETEECMKSVCRTMFRQWETLCAKADVVSVLLWIADGSEILEYSGKLDQTFEWAYWLGIANPNPNPEQTRPSKRDRLSFFQYPVKYIPNAAPRPYSWLKRLIEVIRETGEQITKKPIRIGATFDNGPEFAISKFKYKRHPEIANAHSAYPHSFVTCDSILHADSESYAAFPGGIPEGTSLGTFLGAQFREFAKDLNYDYIWLSNGMGFGTETWEITGALFDKTRFYPEAALKTSNKMLRFWHDFYSAYPDVIVETRGSNYSAGIEMASDAAPLKELYRDFKIVPPVNSPWAALNDSTGLELAAWMSHIAELPEKRIPYRFYAHDPWFLNSPWLDRYGREPWDIYLPLSVGRISEEGKIETPDSLAILTVDNSRGQMPDQVPSEVIPHLLNAFQNAPDSPGPLVWIYPFYEYANTIVSEKGLEDTLSEDLFLGEAIQHGLPLNTVIGTDVLRKLAKDGRSALKGRILIVPVSAWNSEIEQFFMQGGHGIVYGSLKNAPVNLRKLLNVNLSEPLQGSMNLHFFGNPDFTESGSGSDRVFYHEAFNGGGAVETTPDENKVFAVLKQNSETRIAALVRNIPGGGKIGFVKTILPCAKTIIPGRGSDYASIHDVYQTPVLMRYLLSEFGWHIRTRSLEPDGLTHRINISRHDNAFFFSVFSRNTASALEISTPFGAPIPNEMETEIKNDTSFWHPGKSWHKECRAFLRGQQHGIISCKIATAEQVELTARRTYIGLRDAEVRFFPPDGFDSTLEAVLMPNYCSYAMMCNFEPYSFEWEQTPQGRCMLFHHITGALSIAW